MPATPMEADAKARELGADSWIHGIHWTWSNGFPSRTAAEAFIQWLDSNNFEHRGICRANEKYDIRWR